MNSSISKKPALRGLILAAGFGTRLAPVTDHIPKPLLPLGNSTLLDMIIDAMIRAGVEEIAVNTHHLGDQIAQHIAARQDAERFILFPETEILGTGGALSGARDFLSQSDFFLLHNGDVLSDIDLGSLIEAHKNNSVLATLALVNWPAVNSVIVEDDGSDHSSILAIAHMPESLGENAGRHLTFTGIGVYSRALLAEITPGFSSLITPLVKAIAEAPGSVKGFMQAGLQWDDLGTLARWLSAWEKHVQTPNMGAGKLRVERLTGHGSDRKFWRLATADWSAVAVKNPEADEHPSRGMGADPLDEFKYFVSIGRFLKKYDLGAPAFLSVEDDAATALMEDLGPDSLYSLCNSVPRNLSHLKQTYHKVVDQLVLLQEHTAEARDECPEAVSRCLDESMLRWETEYFRNNYLINHRGFSSQETELLGLPFQKLAARVSSQPKVLLHRDFQSQNIMLPRGETKLVDFQGLRLGPQCYDVMSLAFDPYVDFALADRWSVVEYFCREAGKSNKLVSFLGSSPSEQTLMAWATEAGLQRLMQALGAYTFLGHVKGKTDFLQHIPRAEALLVALLTKHRTDNKFMSELAGYISKGSS